MRDKYQEEVEFVLIYVREAHPRDGWQYPGWSGVKDPASPAERTQVATQCRRELGLDFTTVVDSMDDAVALRWSAWPERLFVVSLDGRVVYTGDQGPFGFDPAADYPGYRGVPKRGIDLESFLDSYLPQRGLAASRHAPEEPERPLVLR